MIIGYEALPAGIPTARILAGSGAFASGEELIASSSQQTYAHFAPHCATARRLVSRAKERGVFKLRAPLQERDPIWYVLWFIATDWPKKNTTRE